MQGSNVLHVTTYPFSTFHPPFHNLIPFYLNHFLIPYPSFHPRLSTTMTRESKRCVEFTCFPLLPTEIRLKIFEFSIPDTPRLLPSPPVPGLLVSHEARSVYTKAYSPCFQPLLGAGTLAPSVSGFLSKQANFDHDILFFGEFFPDCSWHKHEIWSQPFAKYLVDGAAEKIQYLAVRYFCTWSHDAAHRLLQMKALKTLTIAIDETKYYKWEGDEHWSVSQQVNWGFPLQEMEVREGDEQRQFKSQIQRHLEQIELYYPGYKAPKLKFARMLYTFSGLDNCWTSTGAGFEQVHGRVEDHAENETMAQWRLTQSSYDSCRMNSG